MYTIQALLDGYAKREFSPIEITREYVERAKENVDLNAFITITEDIALKQAEIAEKRWRLGEAGQLEGIPLAYKDNLYTKGVPTTSGSLIDRDFVPTEHAGIIRTLNREGAVMIGKTNMHEFAFGITNNNPFYGPAKNPWHTAFISGGSSGGSAVATAADLCVASIGTDTGGSVRIPASCCGLIGLKPTHGLLDASGVTHISWHLDHLGLLTRNVSDLVILMEALTEREYAVPPLEGDSPSDLRGVNVGVPTNFFTEQIEADVLHTYEHTLARMEELGALLVDVDVPLVDEAIPLTFSLAIGEAGYVHKDRIKSHLNDYGSDVRQVMESSHSISAVSYIEALEKRRDIAHACDRLLEHVDVLITPTLPALPKPIGQEDVIINGLSEPIFNCYIRYTSYFNLTGHPALSLPAGLTGEPELPAGVQLIGRKWKEKELIRVAKVYEAHYLTEFYEKRERVCKPAGGS